MKYIIMADGKGQRWKNFQGIQKCQIQIGSKTLLEITCDLIHNLDSSAEIYITSHNPQLQVEGATRYEPQNNVLEIDRFTVELIEPDVCFLYGDVLYSENAMRCIIEHKTDTVLTFGSTKKIFAIKIADDIFFKSHLNRVRELFLKNELKECIGWEVYHSMQGLPIESRDIGENYIVIEDDTRDFNAPSDLLEYQKEQHEN